MSRHGQEAHAFVKRDEGSFVGLAEPEEIDKKGREISNSGGPIIFTSF